MSSTLISPLGAEPSQQEKPPSPFFQTTDRDGYTINFNNVSILEYLKFISQIANVNFIYQENELNFNITIISEGSTRLVDVMAALVQVLRINGFDLLEQGNNLIITRSGRAKQIATIFSEKDLATAKQIPPIMTYVFKVKNANPSNISAILTPFLSFDAIIEVSEETRHVIITDITQNIEQIQRLMETLDAPDLPLEIDSYQAKHNPIDLLISLARQMITPLAEGNPVIFAPQENAQTIFLISTPFLLEKTLSILEDLDLPPAIEKSFQGTLTGNNILIYHIKHKPMPMIEGALKQITADLKTNDHTSQVLLEALESIKYIRASHALVFIGSKSALEEVEKLLQNLDTPYTDKELNLMHQGFYLYKIQRGTEGQIKQSLSKLISTLKQTPIDNATLIATIQSMRWVQENNSLLFIGDERSLETIAQLLPSFDIPAHEGKTASSLPLSNDFFIYKPRNLTGEQFIDQIQKVYSDLKTSGLADPAFLHALSSAKLSSNEAVVFTGDPQSLDRVRALVTLIDGEAAPEKTQMAVYVYKIENSNYSYIKEGLDKLGYSLPKTSDLRKTIESAEYLQASHSIVFRGKEISITKIKEILPTLDTPDQGRSSDFFVYRPKNLKPGNFLSLIQSMAANMKANGFTDSALLTTLSSARLNSDQKGILFVGSTTSIDRVKELLPTLDTPSSQHALTDERSDFLVYHPVNKHPKEFLAIVHNMASDMEASKLANPNLIYTLQFAQLTANQKAILFTGTNSSIQEVKDLLPSIDLKSKGGSNVDDEKTGFFVYRPVYAPAELIQKNALELAKDMDRSGFANTELINTLQSSQVTSNGKAVLFTGAPKTIEELKTLIPSIDITIKGQDATAFFIYKVQYLTGPALMEDLRDSAKALPQTTPSEQEVVTAIESMRFIETTNSIVFNGTPQALDRIKALINHLDTTSAKVEPPTRAATDYKIYKPKNVAGDELVRLLRDFEKNLMRSGLSEKPLFDVINHLQWMPATSSILVSGDATGVSEVYSLLERFDAVRTDDDSEKKIENLPDTSFLIYKLDYHSGDEIVAALKQVGQDLNLTGTESNKELFTAINALQWIEITNSLISTGSADTLAKLRKLIESIDVPLKQVFVEVLVLETTLGNALNFGLRWGSQGKYRDRFAYATGSFPQDSSNNEDTLRDFQTNLASISATTTPTGSFIPFTTGFGLGVIGDIVLHKGQTYFSLGSLVNAIKEDGDSTVVINQKIVTQDNTNSTLFVGNNVPYTGSFVTNTANGNNIQTANLEYRDIGVNLSITPKIGNNDVITMSIQQDISELINPNIGSTTSTDQVTGITTSKTSSRTVVSVPDQSFLILSGQIQNTKTRTKTSIPCLGGLPIIGAFFSQNDYQKNITDLIIFVRPHIIKSFDEYKALTQRQENIYRSRTDDPETFDEALELVKTPDDH